MTFEECLEKYPIHKSYIGKYRYNKDIKNYDEVSKFISMNGQIGNFHFVLYNCFTTEFECYTFETLRVDGYVNINGKDTGFYPAVNYDTGWTILANDDGLLCNDYRLFIPCIPLYKKLADYRNRAINEMSEERWMLEQIAYTYDKQNYMAGYIFTDKYQLKKFWYENFL